MASGLAASVLPTCWGCWPRGGPSPGPRSLEIVLTHSDGPGVPSFPGLPSWEGEAGSEAQSFGSRKGGPGGRRGSRGQGGCARRGFAGFMFLLMKSRELGDFLSLAGVEGNQLVPEPCRGCPHAC